MLVEPDSKYQPTIELRCDGSRTLKGKVRTVSKYRLPSSSWNKWDSLTVQNIFPGPTDSEPRSMLQFVRDCLLWMHSLPGFAYLREDARKFQLCDGLITLVIELLKEEYDMHDHDDPTSDLLSNSYNRLRPKIRPLFTSLLDSEDSENQNHEEIMPYGSVLFKALTGRCLFIRPKDGKHQVLGDGLYTVPPMSVEDCVFYDSKAEFVLV
jgi:hypothetical protein